jgi:hypothetical protein
MSGVLGERTQDTFPCRADHGTRGGRQHRKDAFSSRGIEMKNSHSHFNFGAHVRAGTQSKNFSSLLPIGLFAALVVGLVFLS